MFSHRRICALTVSAGVKHKSGCCSLEAKDQHKFLMHTTLNHRLTIFSIISIISLFLDGHFFTKKPG